MSVIVIYPEKKLGFQPRKIYGDPKVYCRHCTCSKCLNVETDAKEFKSCPRCLTVFCDTSCYSREETHLEFCRSIKCYESRLDQWTQNYLMKHYPQSAKNPLFKLSESYLYIWGRWITTRVMSSLLSSWLKMIDIEDIIPMKHDCKSEVINPFSSSSSSSSSSPALFDFLSLASSFSSSSTSSSSSSSSSSLDGQQKKAHAYSVKLQDLRKPGFTFHSDEQDQREKKVEEPPLQKKKNRRSVRIKNKKKKEAELNRLKNEHEKKREKRKKKKPTKQPQPEEKKEQEEEPASDYHRSLMERSGFDLKTMMTMGRNQCRVCKWKSMNGFDNIFVSGDQTNKQVSAEEAQMEHESDVLADQIIAKSLAEVAAGLKLTDEQIKLL